MLKEEARSGGLRASSYSVGVLAFAVVVVVGSGD